ncbi:hypothetical protein [Chitinophaga silvatica]|nr:hypothetical protein [Chitinophaga silvatica]
MKGSQRLFSQLLPTNGQDVGRRTPGRSKELLRKRDERMVYRHYYYLRICKKRYDEIIQMLSEEFDISGHTIIERLQIDINLQLLKQLATLQPDLNDLRKIYPWLVWK